MEDLKIIQKVLDEAKIPYSQDPDEEIKLESIQLVMIVALLEDECDIEIPDDYLEIEQFNTVNKISSIIANLI